MTRSLDEANREISRVRGLPYGSARTQAAEHQVRLVEAEGPDGARSYALLALVESYVWGGEVQRAYLPFTQAVRWYDEHPEHVDENDVHQLFWSFKWMVGHLSDFPDVPAAQIDATLADMERRYAVLGLGNDGVAFEKYRWARSRGGPDVDALYEEWVRTPRDTFSQCEVCDPANRAWHLVDRGDVDEARRLIEATLATGGTCATQPAGMLSTLAMLHLSAGRADEAVSAHRRAVAALASASSDMAHARGERFLRLAAGGHPARALRALASDAQLLVRADTPDDRFWFLVSVVAGTAAVLPTHGGTPVRFDGVPVDDVAGLHTWAVDEAAALARAFDARNGTARYTDALAAARRTAPYEVRLELDVLPAVGATEPGATASTDSAPGPDTDDEPTLVRAERLTAEGEFVTAARTWLQVAGQAESDGRLADAGLALAEAARCAQEAGDDDGAAATYPVAVARMRAGGVAVPEVVPVVVAWAPVAVATGTGAAVVDVVDALLADLTDASVGSRDPLLDPAVEVAGADLDERLSYARRRARADLHDTAARVLASAGTEHAADAARRAGRAAEGYAGVDALGDAAHAFWLAGRLHAQLGAVDEAVWNLESAVEGFTVARRPDLRSEASSALVDVLRGAGRDGQADEVLRALTR